MIGVWIWPAGFAVWLCGLAFGCWLGWGWGWEHGAEDARLQAVQDDTRRRPVWQRAEVAHDWAAHVEQALVVANIQRFDQAMADHQPQTELMPVAADPRTDTAWTRDMAADMDAWIRRNIWEQP